MTEMMSKMRADMPHEFEAYVAGSEASNACDEQVDGPYESQEADAMEAYLHDTNSDDPSCSFAELAAEFSTSDKTGPTIDDKLTKLIAELLADRLAKAKIDQPTGWRLSTTREL